MKVAATYVGIYSIDMNCLRLRALKKGTEPVV